MFTIQFRKGLTKFNHLLAGTVQPRFKTSCAISCLGLSKLWRNFRPYNASEGQQQTKIAIKFKLSATRRQKKKGLHAFKKAGVLPKLSYRPPWGQRYNSRNSVSSPIIKPLSHHLARGGRAALLPCGVCHGPDGILITVL
ncbi:hypothetical protein BaRGS_00036566 [Batillaria attramentaria]|uniref:Uncharacterized protein n=1 Tax=Batillaria attramentaria TaxID=370345 RepID=A0ABD0JB55_9CAEN